MRPTEAIELVVNLAASFATIESERRSAAGDIQIEGRIESLPPTTPANSFKVAGVTVMTDGSTRIEKGGDTGLPFSDLEIGQRIHVVARAAGSDHLAVSVRIQNTTTIPVNVNGVIDDLSGNASAFEFTVEDRLVKGDTLTEFFGDGDNLDSFDDLAVGVRVQVKGQQRDGFVYAGRIHVGGSGDEDDEDDDQESSASIHGVLTTINGSTLTVGGTTVRANDSTVVQRHGDTQTLDVLRTGMTLHVVGDRHEDGSMDARRISIMDDEVGGQVQIEGPAGGVQGTCPAASFRVNGIAVKTDGGTAFEGVTCASLRSGTRVVVTGTRQADESVLATSVKMP